MDNSPLGAIPADLRNHIVELAVVQVAPIQIFQNSASAKSPLVFESETGHARALIQTCRQLRQETMHPFYARNTFLIEAWKVKLGVHGAVARRKKGDALESLTRFVAIVQKMGATDVGGITIDRGHMTSEDILYNTSKQNIQGFLMPTEDAIDVVKAGIRAPVCVKFAMPYLTDGVWDMVEVCVDGDNLGTSIRENHETIRAVFANNLLASTFIVGGLLIPWADDIARRNR